MPQTGAFISGCEGLELTDWETDFFQRTSPWGLILFARNVLSPAQLLALTTQFRTCVGRKDAPVFIDQEGGRVQRLAPPLAYWRSYPSARHYGNLYATDKIAALRAARNVGRLMAEDLTAAGITANCLPVLDVPQQNASDVIGHRAYGFAVEEVMVLARAHAAGLSDGGVMPVMKHIPGHGRALVDSHLDLPVVDAPLNNLREIDFPPFAAFADCPMAMTAHVIYTAVDNKNPATLSRKVIRSVIRDDIGFRGLLMTDDLSMKALGGSFTDKTKRALAAGCDVALYCFAVHAEMEEVAAAAGPLKSKSLARAKAALKTRRKPLPFDRKAAVKDLDRVLAG
jgi:beta-N-acetylhexosaminidase